MSGKKFQLKDQETSFFDGESGLSVTRDEVVTIDTSAGTGKATMRAIKAGGLIEVTKPKADANGDASDKGAGAKEKPPKGDKK